ncbi:hypothetical protein K227x_39960 [Rubripirellula lacrimiformis]|uniref:Glycosyltransferase RgtA/B/C/D-like domain-containing protein n=1 Tax=Rubripirellula lacrimiformis TaxID=1930273 RepID=A0A517NEP0_9BACT|nr:glycosyltransferase family 39 protein [Rubripirellula lacrimiformis]QDT05595.1 hypothetical protein K227x_39960 [Rubripirellula lacrimiformis]
MNPLRWLAATPYRYPAVLVGYFALHVIVRASLSSSLTFDEAEQVYLSQWWHVGYNGQPPLYTWLQTPILDTIGQAALALPLLKNLFLLLTYLCVYGAVGRATGNRVTGIAASAAMLTMPQIAWESHRDLSHTVAALFAATWLFWAIVNVRQRPSMAGYLAIGFATAAGLLFKYNFAVILVAFMGAALSIDSFRARLLDTRIVAAIAIALVCIAPHYLWAMEHLETASSKAMEQLLPSEPLSLGRRIELGLLALAGSTFSTCSATCILFSIAFRERLFPRWFRVRNSLPEPVNEKPKRLADAIANVLADDVTCLVERTMIGVAAIMLILAASGNAIDTKNHWLQPYLFLLPVYLVMRFFSRSHIRGLRPQGNDVRTFDIGGGRLGITTGCLALVVLAVVVGRPLTASVRGDYSWLNMPFDTVAEEIKRIHPQPDMIAASNIRFAGNLRAHFPDMPVITISDLPFRRPAGLSFPPKDTDRILLVVDRKSDGDGQGGLRRLSQSVETTLAAIDTRWHDVDIRYQYGSGDTTHFRFCEVAGMGTAIKSGELPPGVDVPVTGYPDGRRPVHRIAELPDLTY